MTGTVGGPKALDLGPEQELSKPTTVGSDGRFDRRAGAERRTLPKVRVGVERGVALGAETLVGGIDMARAPVEADIQSPPPAYGGAAHELLALTRALWASPFRGRAGLLAIGIAAAIGANLVGQVRLNQWYGDFFDALQQLDAVAFGMQLAVFFAIVAVLLALVVGQTWLNEMLKIRLREWLSEDLLSEWLAAKRAYRLSAADRAGINPDQRIAEDTRKLTDLSAALSVGLLQASLLLVSFIGILWALSENVVFVVGGERWTIPGYMVWIALGYALTGTLIASKVGFPLIGLNADRYAREAEFRFDLVRVNESAESIALYGGEADERRQIASSFSGVILAMRRLANALTRLTWITSGYGWIAIVVPIAAAAPGYFSGGLTLGGLMMVVGAFSQVQQSLRWFVDNLASIADWRATLHRVSAFRASLLLLDQVDQEIEHIALQEDPEGRLVLDDVSVLFSDGRVTVGDARFEIRAGERVHIVGGTATSANTLLRAVAGLWPWGSGSIWTPAPTAMMFLPQRPYLPRGSLCAAICYPLPPAAFEQAQIEAALERVGLGDLRGMLYREERLDKRLSLGRQQLLAFARLLLHRPSWVFLDNATSALDESNERLALSVLTQELAGSAVLSIGHSPGLAALKGRSLTLAHAAGGTLLRQTLRLLPAGGWAWTPS